MEEDGDMAEVISAIGRLQAGEPDTRSTLLRLWDSAAQASPMRRCTLAHFIADTETDAAAELDWDKAALKAATGQADGDADALTPQLVSFLPSLHLNLADAHQRMGHFVLARIHAEAGLRRARSLPDGGYGSMVRSALRRLLAALDKPSDHISGAP